MNQRCSLKAKKRDISTAGYLNQLRSSGFIPSIVYHNGGNIAVYFSYIDFRNVYTQAQQHVPIELQIEGEETKTVLIKGFDIHPVKKTVIHVDLQTLTHEVEFNVKIPIRIIGNSPGVRKGGVLEHKLHKLSVRTKLDHIIDFFDVDISKLDIRDGIYVKDLSVSKELQIKSNSSTLIVTVSPSRATRLEEASMMKENQGKTGQAKGSTKVPAKAPAKGPTKMPAKKK